MERIFGLMLLFAVAVFGQANYWVNISGNLAAAVASSQPTQTPYIPSPNANIVISCPSLVFPEGGFYAAWTNTVGMNNGLAVVSFPGATAWSIPTPLTPCQLIIPGAPPDAGLYYINITPAMAGTSVSWSSVLSYGGYPR
jgi:hypothetical protein